MQFNELPSEMQAQLNAERLALPTINEPYRVLVHNPAGTRYFEAKRCQREWRDNSNGNYMPFGGGSYWTIRYGEVGWRRVKHLMGGGYDVELTQSKCFCKTINGTDIPKSVATKAEVLSLARKIGIFNI